jgi:hypothetical protein
MENAYLNALTAHSTAIEHALIVILLAPRAQILLLVQFVNLNMRWLTESALANAQKDLLTKAITIVSRAKTKIVWFAQKQISTNVQSAKLKSFSMMNVSQLARKVITSIQKQTLVKLALKTVKIAQLLPAPNVPKASSSMIKTRDTVSIVTRNKKSLKEIPAKYVNQQNA